MQVFCDSENGTTGVEVSILPNRVLYTFNWETFLTSGTKQTHFQVCFCL